jgi:hypothetical protein
MRQERSLVRRSCRFSHLSMPKKKDVPQVGIKFDSEKPDYSLLPPHALDELVKVLTMGKVKYSRENWRLLEDGENRYFAAAQRHLWALRKGETYDPESGLHHAAHAAACVLFLIELQAVQN